MRYLLDTHALIWFINGDKELSAKARKAIESDGAENFVSIASLWEMAIKISLERLDLETNFEEVKQKMINNNFQILPISFEDILKISNLPFHHRDPFDRMIIAQSLTNRLVIISRDKLFENYPIKLVW